MWIRSFWACEPCEEAHDSGGNFQLPAKCGPGSSPPQEVKKVERNRAEPLQRPVPLGVIRPRPRNAPPSVVWDCVMPQRLISADVFACAVVVEKQPKSASLDWKDTGEADLSDPETVLCTLLVCAKGGLNANGQKEWYKKVLEDEKGALELRTAWKPLSSGPCAWGTRNRQSPLWEPLQAAFGAVWHADDLNKVGAAMQAWDGPGCCDALLPSRVRYYFEKPPVGPKQTTKDKSKPRWQSWSVMKIARLIKDTSKSEGVSCGRRWPWTSASTMSRRRGSA